MRLNLGCGFNKRPGWLNADIEVGCDPDFVVDLEQTPWPWLDDSASEVALFHVLEHLGKDVSNYFAIIRELWRVCRANALISIVAPHPYCDHFLWDPTHVRPITLGGLRMLSCARNHRMISEQSAETPLGFYLGVDFEIEAFHHVWRRPWREKLAAQKVTAEELEARALSEINVIQETHFAMRAIKPARLVDDQRNGHAETAQNIPST